MKRPPRLTRSAPALWLAGLLLVAACTPLPPANPAPPAVGPAAASQAPAARPAPADPAADPAPATAAGAPPDSAAAAAPGAAPETPDDAATAAATPPAGPALEAAMAQKVAAARSAPLEAEISADPAVVEGRLDNGLTYILRRNELPENRAQLWLVVNAGSLEEDDDQRGLAHFIEHLAFNGTENYGELEIVRYLEGIGMRFGPDANAYTSFDETVYQLNLPTDDPQVLDNAVFILSEWADRVSFDPKIIDDERGVLVEEWRLGRGAGARLRDQQYPVLYHGSRYAERLPIGDKEVLETAPYAALERFYRDWYRPDLMAVIAVGDIDPQAMYRRIVRHFGTIPARQDPRPRQAWPVPDHEETLVSIATDPEATDTTVGVYYKHPRAPEGSYGDYRRSLVEGLYGQMLNARLAELAQRPEPPFLYAVASTGSLGRTADSYYLAAGVEKGGVQPGLAALLTEVERVERHGFAPAELERAKKDLLRAYQQAYLERHQHDSADFAAEYTRHFLDGEPIPGIDVEVALVNRFVPGITLAEVEALARQYLRDDNRVILVSGPESSAATLPSEDELLATFSRAEGTEVEPWVDRVRDEPLVAELPTPGPVVAERHIEKVGVTEWRLANGVKVVLKPTDFKNQELYLTAVSPGGYSLAPEEDAASARFAVTAVSEGGLGQFDQVELEKALAGKVATMALYIDELQEGVNGFAAPEDLETLLQLVYLGFTAPRADEEAFEALRARLEVLLANRSAQPQTVFDDRLTEVLSQGAPWRRPLDEEMLGEIDLDTALDFYRDRFGDASDFTFILVGNFEPAAIRPLVETYLGGLPAAGRRESWRDLGVRPPDELVRFEVEQGLEPKAEVALYFTGEAPFSRKRRIEIDALAELLGQRLRESLREDKGAVYGVAVDASLLRDPYPHYAFHIGFSCAPERVDELVLQVFAEIFLAQEEGFSAPSLAGVREAELRQRELLLKENTFWLGALRTYYTLGLDPSRLLDHRKLLDSLTLKGVEKAARRYLDPERFVLGVLEPQPGVVEETGEAGAGDAVEAPEQQEAPAAAEEPPADGGADEEPEAAAA